VLTFFVLCLLSRTEPSRVNEKFYKWDR